MRVSTAIALLILSLAEPAHAATEARSYAVLSLVGDRLLIVSREMATGSRIDTNKRVFVDVPAPDLDRAMLGAVQVAVKIQAPSAQVVMLETRDPAIFAAQNKTVDESGSGADLLPAVREMAVASKATHLILVTKQRHEAMLRLRDGHIGSGWLEGVGFYVDRTKRLHNSRGEGYVGFLAPFTYFRISIIELASGKVLAQEAVYASTTTGSQSVQHPWDALTAQQKVSRLQSMLRTEAMRVIQVLFKESALQE
jgi:hypothetical protein